MAPRSLAGPLLIVALAAPSWGAEPAPPPKAPASSPLVETVRVRLAQFDVVVRDRAGKLVGGLGPSDFQVLEADTPLPIAAVDEWGAVPPAPAIAPPTPSPPPPVEAEGAAPSPAPAAPPPPPAERRSIVILFDNLNGTSALLMNRAKRAAREFVRADLRASDSAAVYELDMALRAESGFTSDPVELSRAIDKVTWMPASSFEDDMAESVIAFRSPDSATDQQRLRQMAMVANQVLDWQREHFYETLQSVSDLFSGLPGRRILVLLSAGFPMTTPGDMSRQTGGFTPKFRDLIKALERSGVTVYTIDIGEDLTVGDASKSIDWRNAAYRIGLDDSALEDMGLDSALSSGSPGARRQVLGVIAGETGGRLLTHSDFSKAFEIVEEESTHFYRISCKVPEGRPDARYRKIVVKVRRPGCTVTARRGRYGDVVPGLEEAQGFVGGIVDSLARYRTISVRGSAEPLPAPPGGDVPVVVVAEALGPIDYPRDGAEGVRIDLDFNVVARAGGEVVRRYERSLTARVKPEGVASVRKAFRVEARLQLPPGHYDVQATLRLKDPPQFGTWTAPLAVPAPAAGEGLRFSGLVLADPSADATPLLPTWKPPVGQRDLLEMKDGVRLLPATHADYLPGEILAAFWLRGVPREEGGAPRLDLTVHVTDASGAERAVPSRLLLFQGDAGGQDRGLVAVDLASLAPGAYSIRLTARDPAANGTADARAPFVVTRDAEPAAPPPAGRATSSTSPAS